LRTLSFDDQLIKRTSEFPGNFDYRWCRIFSRGIASKFDGACWFKLSFGHLLTLAYRRVSLDRGMKPIVSEVPGTAISQFPCVCSQCRRGHGLIVHQDMVWVAAKLIQRRRATNRFSEENLFHFRMSHLISGCHSLCHQAFFLRRALRRTWTY
jgi:hypothetical protein